MIRLDRLLSNRGYCTRREARGQLKRILVNGKAPLRVDDKVDPETVTWDGEPLDPERIYVLMHKPLGCTCSHKEGPSSRGAAGGAFESCQLVYELLPERFQQRNPLLSSVGRLDKDTTGALLFTDDGEMLHRLTSPRHKVAKLYEAWLSEPLTSLDQDRICSGEILLDDQPVRPAELELLTPDHVLLTLVEGRYHQVKRMFSAIGNEVVRLHRREFGGLGVTDLTPGSWRHLSSDEVSRLAT
jgi:16S rRNA pseudouridine516 synthase